MANKQTKVKVQTTKAGAKGTLAPNKTARSRCKNPDAVIHQGVMMLEAENSYATDKIKLTPGRTGKFN